MPANYPRWKDGVTPCTHSAARPKKWRPVKNVTVIRVSGSTYRDCQPMQGVFEVVNPKNPIRRWKGGELRCQVYCPWFGVKPPTTFPNIIVKGGLYTVEGDYTGEVIDDISV